MTDELEKRVEILESCVGGLLEANVGLKTLLKEQSDLLHRVLNDTGLIREVGDMVHDVKQHIHPPSRFDRDRHGRQVGYWMGVKILGFDSAADKYVLENGQMVTRQELERVPTQRWQPTKAEILDQAKYTVDASFGLFDDPFADIKLSDLKPKRKKKIRSRKEPPAYRKLEKKDKPK